MIHLRNQRYSAAPLESLKYINNSSDQDHRFSNDNWNGNLCFTGGRWCFQGYDVKVLNIFYILKLIIIYLH